MKLYMQCSLEKETLVSMVTICLFTQGARVWLHEEEQYLPSTVSSCSGGVVVFATEYGQVRP